MRNEYNLKGMQYRGNDAVSEFRHHRPVNYFFPGLNPSEGRAVLFPGCELGLPQAW